MKTIQNNGQSQEKLVLKHLRSGRNLSPVAARSLYRVERLAARILVLRKDGHNIKTIRAQDATGKQYAMYRLIAPCTAGKNPGVEGIF